MARPSTYTPAMGDAICDGLASGISLRTVCAPDDMPAPSTVCKWVSLFPAFREQYTRARETQCEVLAAEILDIADTCRAGERIETKEIGRQCSKCLVAVRWRGRWKHADTDNSDMCDGATADKVLETKTVTADMIDRSRLQVDARKWYLSKVLPKKYGDRLELAGEVTVGLTDAEILRRRFERRAAGETAVSRETGDTTAE